MELLNHLLSFAGATAISVAGLSQLPTLIQLPPKNFDPPLSPARNYESVKPLQAAATIQPAAAPAEVFTTGGQSAGKPKIFKITVSVRRPEDLKVQQGDLVQEGEIIADRVEERNRLAAQKAQLELSLAQINERQIIEPPGLIEVPDMIAPPAPNFEKEAAEIAVAQLELERAKRALELHRNALSTEPIKETNDLDDANRLAEAIGQKINGQELKIEEIGKLKDLPPSVLIHEKLVMQKLQDELKVAESDTNRKESALQQVKLDNISKTSDLEAGVKRAEGELALAKSKLSESQQQAAMEGSRFSIEQARRAEEKNQALAFHSRHLSEVEQQKREKDYQLAQITEKIQAIEEKLNALSTVVAPYTGTIRRVKSLGQLNGDLSFELTLAVNSGSGNLKNAGSSSEPTDSGDGDDTTTTPDDRNTGQ